MGMSVGDTGGRGGRGHRRRGRHHKLMSEINVTPFVDVMLVLLIIFMVAAPLLTVVAPGIAEALFATALGLLAAIPAVIAYNKLSSDASKLGLRMEGFADEFSAILSRQIDEKVAQRA